MGQCEYGKGEKKAKYYDYDKENMIAYECPHPVLPDKNYCGFHDK